MKLQSTLSFFSVIISANNTSPTKFAFSIPFKFSTVFMPVFAMCFPRVYTRYRICPQNIKALFNQLYMFGITTTRIIANNMVKNINSVIFGKFIYKNFIQQPVDFSRFSTKIKSSIFSILSTRPYPTCCYWMNVDFRKDIMKFKIV